MARYNKIFAALDGGDTQLAVARRALSIAHDNNAEVLFVHAIETIAERNWKNDEEVAEAFEKVRLGIEESLDKQLSRARRDDCIPSVTVEVKPGRVETALENAAKKAGADLVVCGVRGLSSVKYAFVGSVSTHLIRHMDCDVLVVHPEAIEDIDEAEYESC